MFLQLCHFAKLNRSGRAGFGTGWLDAIFHAIIAQGAFVSRVVSPVITRNYPEGASHDTVTAAIANILLHIDGIELRADTRAGWTRFQARRVGAVFTHVAMHQPAIRIKEW